MSRRLLFAGLSLVFVGACTLPDGLRSRVRTLTPHDQYGQALRRAGLDSTALGRDWLAASDSAMRAPLALSLPFREAGAYTRSDARAVAWAFVLPRGRQLDVMVRHEGLPARLFVDLFQQTSDSIPRMMHEATAVRDSLGGSRITHEAQDSARYVLRLQPELLRDGRFEIHVRSGPSLAFPVSGGTNRWAQSLFGVPRDAGRRRHEGIDIFAARGTPVVASTAGTVTSTRSNELGGLVVWLRDFDRGLNLYYAHLDAHAVREGDVVEVGDTLGFVGNTGNARTTKPHLHFGIYSRGEGAIDPWPWVRLAEGEASAIVADMSSLGQQVVAKAQPAVMRRSPGPRADSVRRVTTADSLHVAAVNGAWYRVITEEGEAGYIAARTVGRPVSEPVVRSIGRN